MGHYPVPFVGGVLLSERSRLGGVAGTPHEFGHACAGCSRPREAGMAEVVEAQVTPPDARPGSRPGDTQRPIGPGDNEIVRTLPSCE